jgi:hypothetical protein
VTQRGISVRAMNTGTLCQNMSGSAMSSALTRLAAMIHLLLPRRRAACSVRVTLPHSAHRTPAVNAAPVNRVSGSNTWWHCEHRSTPSGFHRRPNITQSTTASGAAIAAYIAQRHGPMSKGSRGANRV